MVGPLGKDFDIEISMVDGGLWERFSYFDIEVSMVSWRRRLFNAALKINDAFWSYLARTHAVVLGSRA